MNNNNIRKAFRHSLTAIAVTAVLGATSAYAEVAQT